MLMLGHWSLTRNVSAYNLLLFDLTTSVTCNLGTIITKNTPIEYAFVIIDVRWWCYCCCWKGSKIGNEIIGRVRMYVNRGQLRKEKTISERFIIRYRTYYCKVSKRGKLFIGYYGIPTYHLLVFSISMKLSCTSYT